MLFFFFQQYLHFGGFETTLAEFEKECLSKEKLIGELEKNVLGEKKREMARV